MQQKTIKREIHYSGTGLHSGKKTSLTLRPAPHDSGIIFRIHTAEGTKEISPTPESVTATSLATTLGSGNYSVSTVEHLLAALRGLEIDNIIIDIHGREIPILDGSAAEFVSLINEAGIRKQNKARKVLRIRKPFTINQGDKSITAEPYNGFMVSYTISFAHPIIGTQKMTLNLTPTTFSEVANARTFGFVQDVKYLQSQGLALGGSLDNAIVLDETGVMNQEGLRYANEFVRHKILDFIGDMAMLPYPLQGKFTVNCSGHALNNEFLRSITTQTNKYLSLVTLHEPQHARQLQELLFPAHDVQIPAQASC